MKRRTYLQTMLAAGLGRAAAQTPAARPIELYVDLSVDPAKEKQMLENFRTHFRPAASKQPGFISVKLLKLRTAIQGAPPAGVNYRFVISFQSEEQRQKWVATAIHQQVWPEIESALRSKNYTVLLFDAE